MSRTDISFQTTDNVTLRGHLYTPTSLPPNAPTKLPCLILSHGYTCLKEMNLTTLSTHFTSTLLLKCLTYDHRGFGTSSVAPNSPRQEIIPATQCADLQDAITFAQGLEGVDGGRIGVWGYSFGGGHVVWVGAVDRRVGCVVAVAPFVDGKVVGRNVRPDLVGGLQGAFWKDRKDRAEGKKPGVLPVVVETPTDMAALPQRESWEYFTTKSTEGWKNELTIRSLEETQSCFPSSRIHDISPTPLLMVIPKRDVVTITDMMLEAYNRAREPKELDLVEGGHFDVFDEDKIGKQVEFLRRTLCEGLGC